jgi:hypothetical protein
VLNPPASIDDFKTEEQRLAWDDWLRSRFTEELKGLAVETQGEPPQFFDPTDTPADVATLPITWGGFPQRISNANPDDSRAAWEEAELAVLDPDFEVAFRPQDEYLEWFTTKRDGKVVRIDFTCEGPEYFEALAHGYPLRYRGARRPGVEGDRDAVVALYRKYVSPDVSPSDLFQGDSYDRFNPWNTTQGAMHLCNVFNTLGAEINIAARATVRRQSGGSELTDEDLLIACSGYGDAGRASDPHIGGEVNALARAGYMVSLGDPVGLYLDLTAFEPAGWNKPDGNPVGDYWHVERGTKDQALRAVYEVRDEDFDVGDITIGGDAIEFGGQIAEFLTMKLTGVAHGEGSIRNTPRACPPAREGVLAPPDPLELKSRSW